MNKKDTIKSIKNVDENLKIHYTCPNGNCGTITWGEWQRLYYKNKLRDGKLCECELCRKDRLEKNSEESVTKGDI